MAHLNINLVIGISIFFIYSVTSLDLLGKSSQCPKPPETCPNINVTFWLYTKSGDKGYQLKETDPKTLSKAPFFKNKPVKMFSHGYSGYRDYAPNPELREAYFKKYTEINIISIDWSLLCPTPCYTQSARNVKLVGMCAAEFLRALIKNQPWIKFRDIHMIGFSLGAQVASQIAYFGKDLGKFAILTALDPAFPLFFKTTTEDIERIDPTDAEFVDVYHTNAGYKGQLTAVGHADFYANHALFQPGCGTNSSCNHWRAVAYYAESINSKVGFYAFPCTNVVSYEFGFCNPKKNTEQILIGANVDRKVRGTYFFTTNSEAPFAKGKIEFKSIDKETDPSPTISLIKQGLNSVRAAVSS